MGSPPRRYLPPRGYVAATLAVGACTLAAAVAVPHIGLSNADALYFLPVVAVAASHGRGPAVYASALGVLAFDYFIVPPAFGFVPEDAAYLITFGVMLAVALTVSAFAAQLREQVDVARDRLERTISLYDLAADLAGAGDAEAVAHVVTTHVRRAFRAEAVVTVGADAQSTAPPEALAGARVCVPLATAGRTFGELWLAPVPRDRVLGPAEHRHVEAFANLAAMALERADLAETAQRARIDAEEERLRNTLLRSVSHDLRTPVAAIQGAASTLLQDAALDPATRTELLQSIHEASVRLGLRIHNLLQVTRLEAGAVNVALEWTPLDEIVGAALTGLEERLTGRPVAVRLPPDLPPLPLDDLLAQQVVGNLVDNALRHTPDGTPIEIDAVVDGEWVVLDVSDRGPGIPVSAEEQVFTKFYRAGGAGHCDGTGLGLAIARAIMDLHRGRIWVEARPGGGARFRAAFPRTSPDLLPPVPESEVVEP